LQDKLRDGDRVVMSGFGAGLSWGTAHVVFNQCHISPVIEY
jgi:3-oxoacyl-[acyl-carrier-protein] synthase-3